VVGFSNVVFNRSIKKMGVMWSVLGADSGSQQGREPVPLCCFAVSRFTFRFMIN